MDYAIYPPIGIGRIGNSPDAFYIAPESIGSTGMQPGGNGQQTPVTSYKDDAYRMKRQAARFVTGGAQMQTRFLEIAGAERSKRALGFAFYSAL